MPVRSVRHFIDNRGNFKIVPLYVRLAHPLFRTSDRRFQLKHFWDVGLNSYLFEDSKDYNDTTAYGVENGGIIMKVASVGELKNQMSRFLKQAQKEDIIVTSRGKPIALISGLSSDDLEDYALVNDEELKSRLEAGIKAADEGKLVAIEDLITKAEAEWSIF